MRTTWKIARAELQTLFYSPMAWLMLVLFAIVVFGRFYDIFDLAVRSQEIGESMNHATRHLFTAQGLGHNGLFVGILDQLYYFFPLLTMGLISRELGTGGIKLFDSSPVTTGQIVIGKYISMCLFSLLMIAILVMTVAAGVLTVPNFETGAVATALLGIYLLMCTYSAIGLLMSSLTSYPVVAAAVTFGVQAGLTYIGGVWQNVDFVCEITWWLALNNRIGGFMSGIVSSADVVYYLLIIAMCLLFTGFRLSFRKRSMHTVLKIGACAGVLIAVLGLGWLSSRPALKLYADTTVDKRNTITDGSRRIMERIEGPVTVTTFVNVLHTDADLMRPVNRNNDIGRYERYMRFHPDMELKYVYYYGKTSRPSPLAATLLSMGVTADSIARRYCEIYGLKFDRLLTLDEARALSPIDLAAEGNPVVTTIEKPGVAAWALRLFDDMEKFPSENEIALAFRALESQPPRVTFLAGRGGADITSGGMNGYDVLFDSPATRISLINQGFDVVQTDIAQGSIPESTDILVVPNPTEELAPAELDMITDYIADGGNVFLLADVDNQRNMNLIAAPLGISFPDGYLVQPHPGSEEIYPHISLNGPAESAARVFPLFARWAEDGIVQPMRMAAAISLPEGEEYIPVFVSSPEGWLKREKANLLDGPLEPDVSLGETRRSQVTIAAVERPDGQRAVVSSDAEWLTNVGLTANYAGVRSSATGLALTLMDWLTDGELPTDQSRGRVDDGRIEFHDTRLDLLYYLYIWILPAAMAVAGFVLYRRRNRR